MAHRYLAKCSHASVSIQVGTLCSVQAWRLGLAWSYLALFNIDDDDGYDQAFCVLIDRPLTQRTLIKSLTTRRFASEPLFAFAVAVRTGRDNCFDGSNLLTALDSPGFEQRPAVTMGIHRE